MTRSLIHPYLKNKRKQFCAYSIIVLSRNKCDKFYIKSVKFYRLQESAPINISLEPVRSIA